MTSEQLDLDPYDGFRACEQEEETDSDCGLAGTKRVLSVRLVLRANGKNVYSHLVHSCEDIPRYRGEHQRAFYLWQAVSRYLNANGDCENITELLETIAADIRNAAQALPHILPSDDFYLVSTVQEVAEVQHVFGSAKDNSAIVIEEDSYAERTTLQALYDGLESTQCQRSHYLK